jgi:hypothetical protein
MRKIERRGNITINQVITTVIAVAGLIMLGLAISKIYGNFANQENINAQKNLDSLMAKVGALENGGESSLGITGLNTQWFIAGWSKDEQGRPEKCFLGSCVCFCKGNLDSDKAKVAKVCQDNGFCKIIEDKNVKVIGKGAFPTYNFNCNKEKEATIENIRLVQNMLILDITVKEEIVELARVYSLEECEVIVSRDRKLTFTPTPA